MIFVICLELKIMSEFNDLILKILVSWHVVVALLRSTWNDNWLLMWPITSEINV